MSRRRRPQEDGIPIRTVLAGGGALLVGALLLWLAFVAPQGLPHKRYYVVTAEFADLANVPQRGADVRIAGRRVGQALDARLDRGRPVIDLQLEEDVEPLRADATARVRPRGLLGQQYVDVVPGHHGRPIPDGGRLPQSRTSASVQLPQVLSAFDAPRRRAVRQVVQGVGEGMAGRGAQLNGTLTAAPPVLRDLEAAAREVAERDDAVRGFVRGSEALSAATLPVREAIARGFDPEALAMRPFRVERPSVQGTLEAAPPALRDVRAGLARTDPLLDATRRFAGAADRFASAAPAALRETRELLVDSRDPLRAARPLLGEAAAAVPDVLAVTAAADPVLPRLRATLDAASRPSAELGRRPCDILGLLSNWRSMLGAGTDGGTIAPLTLLRFETFASGESVAGAGAGRADTGRNPYPEPCVAGTERLPR